MRFVVFLTVSAALIALTAIASPEPAQNPVPIAIVDFPVVSAPAVKRLADSLRLAGDAFSRYCATRGAPAYVLGACRTLVAVQRSADALYSTQFTVQPETVTVHEAAPPAAVDTVRTGPVLAGYYGSGVNGWPATDVDTVTICGTVHFFDHATRIAWPPVRLRIIPGTDSATMTLRSGNRLEQMCQASLNGALSGKDSVPVAWVMEWVTIDGRRLYRPSFHLP